MVCGKHLHSKKVKNVVLLVIRNLEIKKSSYIDIYRIHLVFEKPHIFITKQYLTGACCHGNQNYRFDNTFG